jgi:hypothetical protein
MIKQIIHVEFFGFFCWLGLALFFSLVFFVFFVPARWEGTENRLSKDKQDKAGLSIKHTIARKPSKQYSI